MGWVAGFTKLMPLIGAAINMVERVAGGDVKGKAKQEAAVSAIQNIAPLLGGIDLETLFDQKVLEALRELVDAVVKLMNAARDARARRAA